MIVKLFNCYLSNGILNIEVINTINYLIIKKLKCNQISKSILDITTPIKRSRLSNLRNRKKNR
jgi:hypothetical protein